MADSQAIELLICICRRFGAPADFRAVGPSEWAEFLGKERSEPLRFIPRACAKGELHGSVKIVEPRIIGKPGCADCIVSIMKATGESYGA